VRDPRERAGALPPCAKNGPPVRGHAVRYRTSSSTAHQFVDGAPVRGRRTRPSSSHRMQRVRRPGKGARSRKGCATRGRGRARCRRTRRRVRRREITRSDGAPVRRRCTSSSTAHQYVALAPVRRRRTSTSPSHRVQRVRRPGKGARSRKGCETRQRAGALPPYAKKGPPVRGPAVRCRTSSSTPHQYVDAAPVRRRRTSTSPSHRMQRVRRPGKGARSRKGCATEERVRDTAERASAPRKGCAAEDKGAGHGGGGARRRGGCAAEEEYGTRRRGRHARATRDGHARGALRSRVDAGRATALKGCSHG
jgi:hypothetical protein